MNKKPSLPSIQFLLQETSVDNKRPYGHRSTRSVSSLPMDLQNLSLQAPEDKPPEAPFNYNKAEMIQKQPFNGTPFHPNEKPPSWMLPSDRPTTSHPTTTSHKRSHVRSVSEFTLAPLNHTTTVYNTNNLMTPSSRRHRRSVSANTVDYMVAPSPVSFDRSQSCSPQEVAMTMNSNASNATLFESVAEKSSGEGRYTCPFCQKKFSRPSSLRIHTYSHTGEKPFVCTEPGCGRHFSVQSNMRRHLRVHRFGRSVNSNNTTLTEENEST